MLTALIAGLISSSALVAGAVLGAFFDPSRGLVAAALAFASGALIVALAFDLFEEALRVGGTAVAASGLLAGAATFVTADGLLDRYASNATGFVLLASITLDGVPENLALGVALIGKSLSGILALLVAIFASNLPEALGGAASMRSGGHSKKLAIGVWTLTGGILAAAVVLGNAALAEAGETPLAFVRAFAGGAVLASLANALMPQAYRDGGKLIAFATAAGFLTSFLLTQG